MEFFRRSSGALVLAVVVLSGLGFLAVPLSPSHGPGTSLAPLAAGTAVSPPTRPLVGSEPAATLALGTSAATPTEIALNWTATTVFLPSNYTVAYSTNASSGPWSTASVVSSSTTSTVIGGLSPGGNYTWMVTAHGTLGGSEGSNLLPVTQPTLAYLWNSGETSTSVTLNWTDNATYGASISFGSFSVFESQNGSVPTRVAVLSNASTRSALLAGLAAGASYSFYLETTDCVGGCGATTNVSTQSNTITVGTVVALSATLTVSRPQVDVGMPDLFTCTPSGGQSPFRFTWDFGNGTNVSAPSSVSYAFGVAGPALVYCYVADSASNHYSVSVPVTVHPFPVVLASLNRTAADVGQTISYSCTSSGGTFPALVEWSFGDGATYEGGNTTHAYAANGSYLASCSVTDAAGGQAATSLVVNVSLPLGAMATVNASAAAPGTTLNFTGVPQNGSQPYSSLTWTFGDGTNGSGATVTHSYAAAGNFTATFHVRDANGAAATGSVRVMVTNLVVEVTAIPTSISRGTTVDFSASASGGAGGPYNFTWTFGDGVVGYGASTTHSYSSGGNFAPVLTVRDRLGATTRVPLDTVAVSVPPPPGPWFTAWLVLFAAAIAGAVIAVIALARRRKADAANLPEALSRWVPPTGPQGSARASRACPKCGATNLPIRRTCHNCGTSLRGSP